MLHPQSNQHLHRANALPARTRPRQGPAGRRGFTLLEALMAAGVLLLIVVSVTMAVTAGQHHGFEAQQRISATLAVEELMSRLVPVEYDDLKTWNGYREEVGMMADFSGALLPEAYSSIGRMVTVSNAINFNPKADVHVIGRTLTVRAFDSSDRTLAEVSRFIAYPTPGLTYQEMEDLLIDMNAEP